MCIRDSLLHRAGFEKLCIQALTSVLPWISLLPGASSPSPTPTRRSRSTATSSASSSLVMDVPKGDFRWIAVGSKSQPGVQIVLSNYIQGSPDDLSYVAGL